MFDNFISLGDACAVAASMSKYGSRSWSGVFDWLVTPNFNMVLHLMEHDFKGFMLKENLENLQDNKNTFQDKKFGITFIHDVEYSISLKDNYEDLYAKYNKKIQGFRKELTRKNCFLRSVCSEVELNYILKNKDYIEQIIKKGNRESEIIFLIRNDVIISSKIGFRYYVMLNLYSGASRKLLRGWFDGGEEFLLYCKQNFNIDKLLKNIQFDRD